MKKQIEEMAQIIYDNTEFDTMWDEINASANALYNAGYRKIYDDNAKQCVCYLLGCQEGEKIKAQVAREIFEEIEKTIVDLEYQAKTPRKTVQVEELKVQCNWILHEVIPKALAELKKKYTEGGENE